MKLIIKEILTPPPPTLPQISTQEQQACILQQTCTNGARLPGLATHIYIKSIMNII